MCLLSAVRHVEGLEMLWDSMGGCRGCSVLRREYVRSEPSQTVGLKLTGNKCEGGGHRGRCRCMI